MKKSAFLCLVAGVLAFTACSEKNVESNTELQDEAVLELVAQPDFVFSSLGNTLFSTFSAATRADAQTEVPRPSLYNGVEVNLSVCKSKKEGEEYNASKLSIHIREAIEVTGEANDVTVFIPADLESLCENDASSLAIIESKSTTGRVVYGETEQTLEINGQEVNAKLTFTAEGIQVAVTGVKGSVVDDLKKHYKDGLTVEVWNYFKSSKTTLDGLKDAFNAGATVSFKEKPSVYVNAFAKIPEYWELATDDYFPTITSKVVDHHLVPYLDNEEPLDQKYWVRAYGSKYYYLLRGHKNADDCTVKAVGVTFDNKMVNDADIPDDVEDVPHEIAGNYNVIYY